MPKNSEMRGMSGVLLKMQATTGCRASLVRGEGAIRDLTLEGPAEVVYVGIREV